VLSRRANRDLPRKPSELFYRYARWIDVLLQGVRSLEFPARPELCLPFASRLIARQLPIEGLGTESGVPCIESRGMLVDPARGMVVGVQPFFQRPLGHQQTIALFIPRRHVCVVASDQIIRSLVLTCREFLLALKLLNLRPENLCASGPSNSPPS
jgi:hypothetical protein